jgi:hypothetical protein
MIDKFRTENTSESVFDGSLSAGRERSTLLL